MPRGKEPSWPVQKLILELLVRHGNQPLVIQRSLDFLIAQRGISEDTPGLEWIKKIIERLQDLPLDVLIELPPSVWEKRHDYEAIKDELDRLTGRADTLRQVERKSERPVTIQPLDTSHIGIVLQRQLHDFLSSLSLPGSFLIRSENLLTFVEGSVEAMTGKLNRGIQCLCYKPPFPSHPLFSQAKETFKQETLWTELEQFVDGFNKLLADCTALWHSIYQEAREALDAKEAQFPGVTDVITGIAKELRNLQDNRLLSTTKDTLSLSSRLDAGYHRFIPLIYEDAVGWALGKNLTRIRTEDYDYGLSGDKEFIVRCQLPDRLVILIEFLHEDGSMGFQLAASIRDVHMMLREKYRQSDQAKSLTEAMHRLEVQEESILRSLKQLATVLKTS